jgi:hypothetical protein
MVAGPAQADKEPGPGNPALIIFLKIPEKGYRPAWLKFFSLNTW